MSTLAIRTPLEHKSPLRFFASFATTALNVLDVFAEAQRMAREAQRRYPFI